MKANDKVRAKAVKARRQARQQARQAAAQAGPLASSAKVTAGRGVHRMRAWAAPRLESSGHALESRLAPRVSAMMSSAAKRVDPDPRKRRRWPFLMAGLVALAAAAGAVVRRSSATPWRSSQPQEDAVAADARTEPAANANGAAKAESKARAS